MILKSLSNSSYIFIGKVTSLLAHKVKLTATLGQHTNDKMVSFYMKTPSGFDLEYGYCDYTPDWNSHAVHEFTKVSLWGHDFSVGFQ